MHLHVKGRRSKSFTRQVVESSLVQSRAALGLVTARRDSVSAITPPARPVTYLSQIAHAKVSRTMIVCLTFVTPLYSYLLLVLDSERGFPSWFV
ncbi:hypothetical protein EVAR_52049_1 [Eumeta japonica]|uniref:Uncharacterized protein n=1 Tax=Eumeta variegata TaxID=151549 RepID=A0A4C1Z5V8_EUMVA|nr:hypothetical protein EVAR_52049_1 [Eumeta japonica]